MADVKLDSLGFAFVRLYIKPNNTLEMRHLPYKVDSGANRTTISKKWMNDLGYDDAWIRSGRLLERNERPTVATGEPINNCYIVTLPEIIDNITENHTIVLPTYVIDELKRVTRDKFPLKYNLLEPFFRELPYELVYTLEKIDQFKYPNIRDMKDLPIYYNEV